MALKNPQCRMMPGDPARGPGGLEIEPTGDSVDVEDLPRQEQSRHLPRLHRPEVHLEHGRLAEAKLDKIQVAPHLTQRDAPTCNELVPVEPPTCAA